MPKWAKAFWIVLGVLLLAIVLAYPLAGWNGDWVTAAGGVWLLVLLLGRLVLRICAARTRYLALRSPTGFCSTCGYDLRATADRCPECGTAVPQGHLPTVIRPAAARPKP